MTTEIEQNKIAVAIEWINKLANGMNPIDGSLLPENEIVNNVHISRCLFYVSNLLESVKEKKHRLTKEYELAFKLDQGIAEKVHIAEKTGITKFVREINIVLPEGMKPLGVLQLANQLVSEGYLEELERSDGHKYKSPTELGNSIGISSEWKDGTDGKYLAISYDANAQRVILGKLIV